MNNEVMEVMEVMESPGFGNCQKLRWNRRRLGISRKEFGTLVGLSAKDVWRLECNEDEWMRLPESTVDNIMSHYKPMSSWEPERPDKIIREMSLEPQPETEDEFAKNTCPIIETNYKENNDMKTDELVTTGCGNSTRLKWYRKELGLSQTAMGKLIGLNQSHISVLERDETAWVTLHDETVDKIARFYEDMASGKFEKAKETLSGVNEVKEPVEEQVVEPIKEEVVMEQVNTIEGLHKEDLKILGLIEFAYEELTQSESHEDFVINIRMLKKIVNRYQ